MSLDRSLKSASSLVRHRNVLTRPERLLRLADEDKWNDTKSPIGLPKVGNRKAAVVKAAKTETAAATPAAGAKAPAGKAAPAAAAKAAAPAAGAAKKK